MTEPVLYGPKKAIAAEETKFSSSIQGCSTEVFMFKVTRRRQLFCKRQRIIVDYEVPRRVYPASG